MVEVAKIIDQNNIKTNLVGETKDEVLKELATVLLQNHYITDVDGFMADIYAREEEGQTGIGNYIAIPHGKSPYVDRIGVAIGVTENEIPWESLDGKGVKGIILFAVGDDNEGAQEHLKLLSLFARKLGNDEVIEQLIQAKDADEVVAAFS
ncbi:fructose PTS transporter subunit IIA [Enterococcus hirae]|jgi:PTS system fructose-specific IIA component|uniref:PTS sugar transporter subunit IIA n=1 Tax=Enterococcus hirae TaxID=1354 RepID=UPI0009BF3BA7|nr:fructose PTS transporter subunit IIA [Enterococcus hirae]HCE20029.1 PTS fructose transporter subunit IIA [Enterococcus sp.]EMF0074386.1 PTS sugar transporter subunit IIA [Enterococcus hirae]MBA5265404.1 PTS sugar transporter subunit IIA [Enterococcus hirae]MEB7438860.1 fructose PTS transporter subunit IIA [Enterococcus hirae]OQO47463.1 PTS fructose transporter subunit IIA [Enterococcus hirae]